MVITMENKKQKFNINEEVAILNADGIKVAIGKVVSYNEFRPFDETYAIYIRGYSDVVFVGEERLDYLE